MSLVLLVSPFRILMFPLAVWKCLERALMTAWLASPLMGRFVVFTTIVEGVLGVLDATTSTDSLFAPVLTET